MGPLDWDPGSLAVDPDPHATLAWVRSGGSVRPLTSSFWVVTGHAAALEVLRHPDVRSAPVGDVYASLLPPGAARDEMVHRINFLDPPDHPRVRGLVSTAFTPRRVQAVRPWVEDTARRLLDGIEARLDRLDGTVDLLAEFAHQVPSLVISELLGVPAEDRDELTAFSDAVSPLLSVRVDPDDLAAAVAAAESFHRYLAALVEDRRERPGDDLLSALCVAEEHGERLSMPELLSLTATLYSAGHRTTRDLVTNGLAALLEDPDRYRRVVDGSWSVTDTVGEFLRTQTPTLYVARVTATDCEFDGTAVPAGAPVLVFLAAANRDPAVHAEPDEFAPGRDGPQPLSFAFGAHYCLGANLARLEAEVMLASVCERWPDLEQAEVPTWHQRGPFRGVDRLLVRPR